MRSWKLRGQTSRILVWLGPVRDQKKDDVRWKNVIVAF
jgi:hypothetical protein